MLYEMAVGAGAVGVTGALLGLTVKGVVILRAIKGVNSKDRSEIIRAVGDAMRTRAPRQ